MSGSTTVGSGSDSIVLTLSEDAAAGTDAQFTVNVDGQQIGGLQTVTASHAARQEQTFTFLGNYAPGQHTVTVTFANNFLLPSQSGDRNLYVDKVVYDGQTVSNSTTPIYESPLFPPNSDHNIFGNAVFTVNDTTSASGSNPTTTPGSVSLGSGSDTLVLNMAENEFQGDAQFTVAVDGVQVDGTQTTTAHLNEGQQQEFDVHGNWGSGNHTVTVSYLNDKIGAFYPGTQLADDTTDRNLYVMGMTLNGGPAASSTPWELDTTGSKSFTVTAGSGGGSSSGGSSGGQSSSSGNQTGNSGSTSSSASQTSNNAAITSGSLSGNGSGSSVGMSFIAPSNSATSGNAGSSEASGASGSASNQSSAGSTGSSGGASMTDGSGFTVPGSTDMSGTTSNTSATHGYGGHWSGSHHGWHAGWVPHAHG